jgi:hypothetical protein
MAMTTTKTIPPTIVAARHQSRQKGIAAWQTMDFAT